MTDKQPTAEEILEKWFPNNTLPLTLRERFISAMSEYKSLPVESAGVDKMLHVADITARIKENESMLGMAVFHSDQRMISVLKHRIINLKNKLTYSSHSTQQVVDVGKVEK